MRRLVLSRSIIVCVWLLTITAACAGVSHPHGPPSCAASAATAEMATHLAVADYGLGRMTLAIDGREVVRQSQRFAGDVCYRRALRSALESWLADGDDALSPRALAAGSCTCGRRTTPVDRAACYLNRPELSLRLATTADVAPRVLRKSWVFIIGRAPSAGTMHMAMVRRQRVPGEGIWARNIGREVDERFSASGRAQPP